jgi:acyl-CoA hydrolase
MVIDSELNSMGNSTQAGRRVRDSQSEYSEVTLPTHANTLGNVLGGHVMLLVDLCAGMAAWRHARRPAVTVTVDQMSFLESVHVGQLLVVKSSVNRVFKSSMEVGVKVWVEDACTGEVHHTSSAYLTFVALDENRKPVAIAPVIPETGEEHRRYQEAGLRRELRLLARKTNSSEQRG